jgi:peptide deformylase
MAVYKILHYPHVLLRKKSSPVEKFSPGLSKFAADMVETMYAFEGIGLAAPQVGILKRLMVVDIKSYLENESLKDWHGTIVCKVNGTVAPLEFPLVLVNPEIVRSEGEVHFPYDGCLSFPGVTKGDTTRFKFIELKAQTCSGVPISIECDGIMSICLQHELDHLEGVLFIDRLDDKPSNAEIQSDIEEADEEPARRKRLRKLKLHDARNQSLDFI